MRRQRRISSFSLHDSGALPRIRHEKFVYGYFAANSASLLESVVEDVVTRGGRVQETIDIVLTQG